MKIKEKQDADVDYTCPECGFSEKKKENWAEPFHTGVGAKQEFNLTCGKCGYQMKFFKLKKEKNKKKK